MKRKATMRNRRLTIFPLAIILMSGCGDESSTAPEMLELIGTWQIATWSVTQVAAPMLVVNPFVTAPLGGTDPITDGTLFLYDDGTLLSIFNFPDTAATNQSVLPDSTFLDASDYPVNTWCVFASGEIFDSFCLKKDGEVAAAGELVIDHGDTDEQIFTFVRNGDNMTLTGGPGVLYDFGGADPEPATVMMTLNRVIIDYDRPNITDAGNR